MTPVRQNSSTRTDPRAATARKPTGQAATKAKTENRRSGQSVKASPARKQAGTRTGASHVAQVRLQADEMAALQAVMRQLRLPSTSEALREGIRLLVREASELAAAEEIRHFYGDAPAPVPDGVIRATEEELTAADAARW